ncbi:UvrD-helicase domain-containing protein, partial [Pelagibacteraceae bacterium]|nr:UvrD-helicase domain-containing protein [Pelagibacteraceae bacterium]
MTENSQNYLDLLNKEQRSAVQQTNGSLLVLAGAGSGKTRVLTFRILNILIKKLATPRQILAVTFTNKAASEMKSRIGDALKFPIDNMWVGTFHSLSLRILRQHYEEVGLKKNFLIIDVDDQLKLIKNICEIEKIDTKETSPKYYLSAIDNLKNKGISPNELSENKYRKNDKEIRKIYSIYQSELLRLNSVDFGDLILFCIKIFQKNNNILSKYQNIFKYIHVDEYQDINPIQQQWIQFLYKGNKNICCVGDDDQSIYSWRGADVTNLLNFEKNFENVSIVRLEQNYRSTKNILSCASTLIAKNKGRYGKELWSKNQIGEKITINGFWETKEESIFVTDKIEHIIKEKKNLSEISILFRVAAHTRSFEERLINLGLPYKIIGGLRFYERKEIKDIIAYLRLTNNLSDDLAFERIINVPKRGIGKSTVSKISSYARMNNISLFESAQQLTFKGNSKAKEELYNFTDNILKWQKVKNKFDHIELAKVIIEDSGYLDYLKKEEANSNKPDSLSRIDNLNEFIESLKEFENIEGFLEHVSLVMENLTNTSEETLTLMTMHAAKGLEFDYVFLAGWEEGVFPSQRSIEESGNQGLEEERRLAYVALTRARKKIYITYVNQNRYSFASHDYNLPSRFISELPEDKVEINDSKY